MGPANNASNGSPHQQQGASLVKGGGSHNPAGSLPAGISTDQVRISQLLAGVVTSLLKTLKYSPKPKGKQNFPPLSDDILLKSGSVQREGAPFRHSQLNVPKCVAVNRLLDRRRVD